VLALELAMDACPVRLDLTTVTLLRAGIGKQLGLEHGPATADTQLGGDVVTHVHHSLGTT
jgi:hypothetical protein